MLPRDVPLLLRLYGLGAMLAAPLACRLTRRKLIAQDIAPERLSERAGLPTRPRPDGDVIWLHAASVGESLSLLRLIAELGQRHTAHHFLLTSGTATSARILANRVPPRTTHQFAPLDSPVYLRRFLDHWRPSAAIFVESELWPQMLGQTARRGIPLALVNARISARSARNWKRFPRTARALMHLFAMIHCQDAPTEKLLRDLGLSNARKGANLKSFSGPLPFDSAEHTRMRTLIAGRPVWLAASTHPGEDEIVLAAHARLLRDVPDLLLILVPRHPERADTIERLIAASGLSGAQRSGGGGLDARTQVYLADTLGELGLWYALSPITCLCGSFTPVGGHNPYEPAYAGSAILHGPLHANFAQTYTEMQASGAARQVADSKALADTVAQLLAKPDMRDAARAAAREFAEIQQDALDQITADLSKALSLG